MRLVDQRKLPETLETVEARTLEELCALIESMAIRGAPALGVAGAMGVALARLEGMPVDEAVRRLAKTRPVARDLLWGARRAASAGDPAEEAERIAREDVERNRSLAAHGMALVHDGARVLTHCNTGSLACVSYGTALGIVRAAHEAGRRVHVWVDETRPALQGARLTAWELQRLGISHEVVVDSAAGHLMASKAVDVVLVGADRVTANGDVVNKIGTYTLAVLAAHHGLPFVVAAPTSTFDPSTPTGRDVTIEHRDPTEVLTCGGRNVTPQGTRAFNPVFDVTPVSLVTAYVTEVGVWRPSELTDLMRRLTEEDFGEGAGAS